MAKKRVRKLKVPSPKKKISEKKSVKSKKRFNWLGFVMLGVLVAFFVSMFFIHSPSSTGNTITGNSGNSIIADTFWNWEKGDIDVTIVKYLFFFLILFLVTSILHLMQFPPQPFLRLIISAIVSFLAIAYITPGEIFALMTSYTALGLTLISILPFLILFLATAAIYVPRFRIGRIAASGPTINYMRVLMIILLWTFYAVYITYVVITFFRSGTEISKAVAIIMLVMAILTWLMVFFNKFFRRFIIRVFGNVAREQAAMDVAFAAAAARAARRRVL
jgi:hypothetical protein